jgi:hypothetical protein
MSSASHLNRNLEDQNLAYTTAGHKVAQLHLQAPGSASTTGVPIVGPNYVGSWREFFLIHDGLYSITGFIVAVVQRECAVRVKLRQRAVIQNCNLSIKDVKQKVLH